MSNNVGYLTGVDKVGIPRHLFWGYVGVLIFMVADGLETGWLSPYLIERGLSIQEAALIFSVYGITVAVAAWFSGVFVQAWGPRKSMIIGLTAFTIGTIGFIGLGIPDLNMTFLLPFYGLRGLGYPLFAYAFLVWITYRTEKNRLGTAVGWFWFVFTGGLNVLGAYYSSWIIPKIGEINTLWSALAFVVIGGIFALILNKDKFQFEKEHTKDNAKKAKELIKGITIMYHNPKIAIGGVVRTINTAAAPFAFVIFLPTYMIQFGFTLSEWLQIYGAIFFSNIIFNLIFGIVGDKLGWRNTVMWFGGVGCGIMTLAIYYTPQFLGNNYWAMTIVAILFGAALAGYVPLSALMPSLSPENKGAAMSVLNLGAGLSAFVGPAIVGIFIGSLGVGGIMWMFALLYFFSAFLTQYLVLPVSKDEEQIIELKKAGNWG